MGLITIGVTVATTVIVGAGVLICVVINCAEVSVVVVITEMLTSDVAFGMTMPAVAGVMPIPVAVAVAGSQLPGTPPFSGLEPETAGAAAFIASVTSSVFVALAVADREPEWRSTPEGARGAGVMCSAAELAGRSDVVAIAGGVASASFTSVEVLASPAADDCEVEVGVEAMICKAVGALEVAGESVGRTVAGTVLLNSMFVRIVLVGNCVAEAVVICVSSDGG
jgi:hypothetical protein